ncbi:MAG: efflux RND transporter permease subunit [Victivallaceae bacterium]|nr:efflux RND transporter permease subunit [Victivallaceae bacterium]
MTADREKHNFFIEHPYLAIVVAVVTVICGGIAVFRLPITQYPNVTPPQVSVSTFYPGADAKTLLDTVVIPLEEQINGVEDMIYMKSTVSDSGTVATVVSFKIGSDPDRNVQNVQDRVNWSNAQLPEAVRRQSVIVQQQSGNILLAISLYSPGRRYDSLFMTNYAEINLVQKLKRISGVAEVQVFGSAAYSLRVWLDQKKLAALGLSPDDVAAAVKSQNVQVPAGAVGGAPEADGNLFRFELSARGRLRTPEEFENIVVHSEPSGAEVMLKDVATVELGAENYDSLASFNGNPAAIIVLYQKPEGNGPAISAAARALMKEAATAFPPGLEYGVQYDTTDFIRASISDVAETLFLAVLLVALVSLVFLQNWRMVLVPVLAIPVSIVGTFAVLYAVGYSINLLTLFALILAVGIVVDDAIIVVENISRLMEKEHLPPREAAEKSMRQISGAVAATTAVLLAMFVPICFLSGITGEMYREFGVTLSAAVALSAVNALTLSPALSSLLLKPRGESGKTFAPAALFNAGFTKLSSGVRRLLPPLIRLSLPVMLLYLAGGAAAALLYFKLPRGFIPEEDQGYYFVNVRMPGGSSLAGTAAAAAKTEALMRRLPGIADVVASPGYSLLDGIPTSGSAFVIGILEPWEKRRTAETSASGLIDATMLAAAETIPDALIMAFQAPPLPGIGAAGGVDLMLTAPAGAEPDELNAALDKLLFAAMRSPSLANVFSTFSVDTPGVYINVNRRKALQMGVNLDVLHSTLESLPGINYVNQFNAFGQIYKVEFQSAGEGRAAAGDLMTIYIPNRNGEMVPLGAIAELENRTGAGILSRYNLALAAEIQGEPAPGVSSAEAMAEMEKLAAEVLPAGMTVEWTGMSYQEKIAGGSGRTVYLLAVVFMFLFLAALYDSWLLPWPVLMAIPLALAGAAAFLFMREMTDNIYTQIGVVLLFGMACKTAILIVDFAKRRERDGASAASAAASAAKLRFRAIMMTGMAFILGTLPLMFASGPGSVSRRSIGTAVVGGMLGVALFGILLVPVFYFVLRRIAELLKRRRDK